MRELDDRRSTCSDKDARQRELCQIIAGREALQARLQQLRDDVQLCEANLEALALREEHLMSQMVGEPMDDFDDPDDTDTGGIESAGTTATPSSGPVFFELEAEQGNEPRQAEQGNDDGWSGLSECQPCCFVEMSPRLTPRASSRFVDMSPSSGDRRRASHGGEDYEDSLELGVAKCRLCGARFPLDVGAIERHSRTCSRISDDALRLTCRCSTCGEQLPLAMEAVEAHRCSRAPSTASRCRPDKLGVQRPGQKQPGARR